MVSAGGMQAWLEGVFESGRQLPEDAEGYLLGRGIREETIHRLGISLWRTPADPAPDVEFIKRYRNDDGSWYLDGRLTCPVYSPRGDVIGFEARAWRGVKRITDYRLPPASWNPFLIGLTPESMQKLRDGGNAWIVEGLFDLGLIERIVPETDVVFATVRAKVSDTLVEFLRRWLRPGAWVYVVYDMDETGKKQMYGWTDEKTGKERWGAVRRLERVSIPAQAVSYRGGKDPGEIWERTGLDGLRAAFAHVI